MRSVKAALAVLLLAGLGVVWTRHEPVLAAYQREPNTERLQLRGVDLDQELSDVGASPYEIPLATDGRLRSTELSIADDDPPTPVQRATMFGGPSRLTGSVAGPNGPEVDAVVRIERHGSDGVSTADATTDENGSWSLNGLAGGRFRVRAWTDGGLTMENSTVFFLDDGDARRLDLVLNEISSEPRAAFTTRGDIYLGLTATVAVSLTEHRVGADGVIEVIPLVGGELTLPSRPGFTVTPEVASTDGAGVARFTVRCHQVGSATSTISYLDYRGTVELPRCVPVPDDPARVVTPQPMQVDVALTPAAPVPAAPSIGADIEVTYE